MLYIVYETVGQLERIKKQLQAGYITWIVGRLAVEEVQSYRGKHVNEDSGRASIILHVSDRNYQNMPSHYLGAILMPRGGRTLQDLQSDVGLSQG
jgi:hypothetical protein